MSDLRKRLIRLAHENPGEVREALLPLLRGMSDGISKEAFSRFTSRSKDTYRGGDLLRLDVIDRSGHHWGTIDFTPVRVRRNAQGVEVVSQTMKTQGRTIGRCSYADYPAPHAFSEGWTVEFNRPRKINMGSEEHALTDVVLDALGGMSDRGLIALLGEPGDLGLRVGRVARDGRR